MTTFLISLRSVSLLLAMALPGLLLVKTKLVKSEQGAKVLSSILLYVCQPFITVNAFLNTTYSQDVLLNIVFVILITAILITIVLFLGQLIFIKDKSGEHRNIFSFAGAFGNIGYLCIPFLQFFTNNDPEIILYATCSLVSFNILSWTLGSYTLTRDKKFISIKKAILNPACISFIIVFPLFLFNLNFVGKPELDAVADVFNKFSEMNAPLSMMVLGMKFSDIKLKELFSGYRVYICCAIKNLLFPAIGIGIFSLFNLFVDLSAIRLNIIALSCMPCATVIMMFCSFYDKDGKEAAKAVLLSSLLSVATIPLWFLLLL